MVFIMTKKRTGGLSFIKTSNIFGEIFVYKRFMLVSN